MLAPVVLNDIRVLFMQKTSPKAVKSIRVKAYDVEHAQQLASEIYECETGPDWDFEYDHLVCIDNHPRWT